MPKKKGQCERLFGMSRQDLADALSIDKRTINAWMSSENRPRLCLTQVRTLLEVTEKSLDELITLFKLD